MPSNLNAESDSIVDNINLLKKEKLELEIEKLRVEIDASSDGWKIFSLVAPFFTAAIALFGLFATIWKQINESHRQHEVDRRQFETERIRRFDEKFNQIIKGLGSEEGPVRAGSAVSLLTYLRSEYIDFHEQVYFLLVANLKIQKTENDDITFDLLLHAFENSLRDKSAKLEKQNFEIDDNDNKVSLDLSHCKLKGIRLPEIKLNWTNFEESDLENSNFRGATIHRIRTTGANLSNIQASQAFIMKSIFNDTIAPGARFNGSELHFSHFKHAYLKGAEFQNAFLQSALFVDADIRGAKFTAADLNNTDFRGATIDDIAMKSIIKAHNWWKAVFDPRTYSDLKNIEKKIKEKKYNN